MIRSSSFWAVFLCFLVQYSLAVKHAEFCQKTLDVAIVGAGPSGSYSAYSLRHQGMRVGLFEYSNRIGGRLFSYHFPEAPEISAEFGGMRFVQHVHPRTFSLALELSLTVTQFVGRFGGGDRQRLYLRDTHLTNRDIKEGRVPYDLPQEVKDNMDNIYGYLLEKLTGTRTISRDNVMKLKVADGRELYKLSFSEALGLVTNKETREFLENRGDRFGMFVGNVSATSAFQNVLIENRYNRTLSIAEGMQQLPLRMVEEFLKVSSDHTFTRDRNLFQIRRQRRFSGYTLHFQKTESKNGETKILLGDHEVVCAKKVILAIPYHALTKLRWKELNTPRVRNALKALIPIRAQKIYLVFPNRWWTHLPLNSYDTTTDLLYRESYDFKKSPSTGNAVLLASYANSGSVPIFHELQKNHVSHLMRGSAVGDNRVSIALKERLLNELAEAYNVSRWEIPEPIAGASMFWVSYPFGGGWTMWNKGYTYKNVIARLQRPSKRDEVYVVGSDFAFGDRTTWTEGGLENVDIVMKKFFL